MAYHRLGVSARERTKVLRSEIEVGAWGRVGVADSQGSGLFAQCAIDKGEMVIEYVGELVRRDLSDLRERLYNRRVSHTSAPS
jgi:hypothetical protein